MSTAPEARNEQKPRISTVSETIRNQPGLGRISKSVNFIVCGSCYWSASYLDARPVEKCPACQNVTVDSMPVAGNDVYVYSYEAKRGIIIDFTRARGSE